MGPQTVSAGVQASEVQHTLEPSLSTHCLSSNAAHGLVSIRIKSSHVNKPEQISHNPPGNKRWMQETLRLSVPEITPNLHTKHLLEVWAYIKPIILCCSHWGEKKKKKENVCIIVFSMMWLSESKLASPSCCCWPSVRTSCSGHKKKHRETNTSMCLLQ